jgi:exodeoxyribonuclease VII large subunit
MPEERKIYSVAEINRKARAVLESAMGELWVEGELSRVTIHSSGHWYFTLKDEQAAVSCAMFRNDNQRVAFVPKDGLQVQMLSRASLYEVNGRYQLIAAEMEAAGKGNLQEQFEKLKARLAAEGLFDETRKKPLPLLPQRIGIVTSPTGAAVRDIIHVLTRRFGNLEILLVPSKVQGKGAEQSIVKAIDYLNTRGDIDVMIVGRGGGSIEDLWNFNEEVVTRAIARSEIPVISAVGHEIDFTIADFVADVRAPTPSAAAELAVRERAAIEDDLDLWGRRLQQSLKGLTQDFRIRLGRASQSYVFQEPAALVSRFRLRVDSFKTRLPELLTYSASNRRSILNRSGAAMVYQLQSTVQQTQQRIDEQSMLMSHRMGQKTVSDRQTLIRLKSQLRVLNPLAVLGRGYSMTRSAEGKLVRSAHDLGVGERITTHFADGKVISNIEEIE